MISLTKVMLGWTPNKGDEAEKSHKLVQNAPTQSEAQEASQAIPGCTSQTSYPRVQWENPLDKRGLQNREREREKERMWGT